MIYPKPTVIISLEIKGSYIPDFTHLGPYRLLLNGIKGSAFISFKDQSLRACYMSAIIDREDPGQIISLDVLGKRSNDKMIINQRNQPIYAFWVVVPGHSPRPILAV